MLNQHEDLFFFPITKFTNKTKIPIIYIIKAEKAGCKCGCSLFTVYNINTNSGNNVRTETQNKTCEIQKVKRNWLRRQRRRTERVLNAKQENLVFIFTDSLQEFIQKVTTRRT